MWKMWAVFFLLCYIGEGKASYRHFLWSLSNPVTFPVLEFEYDDYSTEKSVMTNNGMNGLHPGKVIYSKCSGTEAVKGQVKTSWFMIPGKYNVNGIDVEINISDYNGWVTPSVSTPAEYVTKVIQRGWTADNWGDCLPVGTYHPNVVFYFSPARIQVKIPKQKISPGSYLIDIPYYYAFEENKASCSSCVAPANNIPFEILNGGGYKGNLPIKINVRSKCSINSSLINLSHGTMAGRNADGNQTKPYNLNVTCTPGTSLSVKLLGTQKVSGKTDNYTQCGIGGECELTFDNGKYDETMTIDNSKTLSIKSTYRLNDITKPVAESFEGSGVLQVLVN